MRLAADGGHSMYGSYFGTLPWAALGDLMEVVLRNILKHVWLMNVFFYLRFWTKSVS